MAVRKLASSMVYVLAVFFLLFPGSARATTTTLNGSYVTGPSNCIPFGGYSNAYMGFIYKNVPAFTLGAGDTISFDLAAQNDVNIVMDIALATTTSNGSLQENSSGFTTVLSSGTPSSARGDTTAGNYELTYTATSAFVFGGGGLIIRFKPIGTMATDSNCSQVLMHADATDTSGYFAGRFYTDPDGTYPWSGTDSYHIGIVRIVTGSVAWYRDADSDGYGDASTVTYATAQPAGYVANSTDCNDSNSAVHPGATETCNGIDDDCDSSVDEGVTNTYYRDSDSDSYGNSASTTTGCTAPAGYVFSSTDCNDSNAAVHPGAIETCNSIDDDCDTLIDEGVTTAYFRDSDADTYGDVSSTSLGCSAPSGYVSNSTDCNDANAAVHPGATELCNSIDDDCDTLVDEGVTNSYYRDSDGDAYGNVSIVAAACTSPSGYVADATDCNDANAAIHPGATEYCNDLDDDCDSVIDEGAADATTWHADTDSDTFGDASVVITQCDQPGGYVVDDRDCDDGNSDVNPDALEVCNGIDDDCDGTIDVGADDPSTWYADADTDGFGDLATATDECTAPSGYIADATDCDDMDAAVYPGATEVCNGVDDDCNSIVDDGAVDAATWYADVDGDSFGDVSASIAECTPGAGYVADATDCDDTNAAVFPGATEVCNGVDDDCNTLIDDGAIDAPTWYADADSDTFGDAGATIVVCVAPGGYIADDTDCDDTDAAVFPGATEVCNGVDDDCNSIVDDGAVDATTWYADTDGDAFGDIGATQAECAAPAGYIADATDCDDTDASVHPGATEVCNGVDDDCNSIVDDAATDATTWYADVDNDAFGDASTALADCTAPAGYIADATDCDDTNAAVYPGADEVCNDVDDNCDALVDNDAIDALTWYVDADEDTFGDPAVTLDACTAPDGYLEDDTDCDDSDATVYPGATEIPYDGIDQDCDGNDVLDADGDGYSAEAAGGDDCDDNDALVFPGSVETADGVDENCDGIVDEGTDWYDDDGDGYTEDGGD